jgi:hypothetical protein
MTIDLYKYNLDYLETVWLFEFISGGAGDFFITLASGCSTLHVKTQADLITRMQEFKRTGKMPGNNIGKKFIENESLSEVEERIKNHLEELEPQYAPEQLSVCTHPGQSVDLASKIQSIFPKQKIKKVCLSPTTKLSREYITFYYGYTKEQILTRQEDLMLWEDPLNTMVIDPVELAINNPEELKELATFIAGELDEEMYDYVYDIYYHHKLKPFKDYYDGTQSIH